MTKITVLDLQDARLMGENKYRTAMEQIEADWLKPVRQMARRLILNRLDDQTKAQLRKDLPDEMAEVENGETV